MDLEEQEQLEKPLYVNGGLVEGSNDTQKEDFTKNDDSLVDGEITPPPTIPRETDEYLAWTLGGDLVSPLKQASPFPLPDECDHDAEPTSTEVEERLAWLE